MSYELPALAYSKESLEPHIDSMTMDIHHGKHHATYVANYNKLISGRPDLECKPVEKVLSQLEAIPAEIRTGVRNQGGGVANHTFYWRCLSPKGGGVPSGNLAAAIDKAFGNFESFKQQFEAAGLARFGSGWVWLVANAGKLEICTTANQDSPIMGKAIAGCEGVPILAVDLWEHAYYLKYQNRRGDYLKTIWNVIDWNAAAERFAAAS